MVKKKIAPVILKVQRMVPELNRPIILEIDDCPTANFNDSTENNECFTEEIDNSSSGEKEVHVNVLIYHSSNASVQRSVALTRSQSFLYTPLQHKTFPIAEVVLGS